MCGIIGYFNNNTKPDDLIVLRKVMIESKIRGKHASGIAWYNGQKIESYIKPVPISDLLNTFNLFAMLYNKSKICMIGHTRYCTSNIEYNQPIVSEDYNLAIAHNGVISQDSPDTWYNKFGYHCTGKNDSELILRALENMDNPINKFPESSIATVAIRDGKLEYFRNSKRPMWMGHIGSGIVIASTYDILNRSGVSNIKKISVANDLQERSYLQWKI